MGPGQVQIPFKFLLPPNLPGSFYAKGSANGENFKCAVNYQIKMITYDGCNVKNRTFKIGKDD